MSVDRSQILRGIKVIELAAVLAGPSVGTFFAELGAQVLKVENPGTNGDPTRSWKTAGEDPLSPISSYYASANWGKEVIYLNLRSSSDLESLMSLIREADILLINFKAGDEFKYDLDYNSLRKTCPKLIVGHIIGFPNEDRPAFDVVVQAETGLMSLNGHPGSAPLKWPLPIVDILAAHQLKEGLLAALYHRGITGKGACIAVSLFDSAIASLFNVGTNVLMAGLNPGQLGPLHPNIAPYGEIITSEDGRSIVLAIGTDLQFSGLCAVLGCSVEFMTDFSTNISRIKDRKRLGAEIQRLARHIPFDVLEKGLMTHKIPFGRIKQVKEVVDVLPESYLLREKTEGTETVRLRTSAFTFRN